MALQDLIAKLRTLWSAVVSHGRNYGCLAENTSDNSDKPVSNRPESANSVEKDASLR